MAAELRIQLLEGETVVHQFSRSTSQPATASLQRLLEQGLGWLQAYQGAVSFEQWAQDVRRARELQP